MDELIQGFMAYLSGELGSQYTYTYGKSLSPGQEGDLPMLCFSPVGTDVRYSGAGSAQMLLYAYSLDITLYVSLKDYMDVNPEVDVITHTRDTIQRVEARTSDRVLVEATILGAIYKGMRAPATPMTPNLRKWADTLESVRISYNEGAQQRSGSWIVPVVLRLTLTARAPGCP